MLAFDIETLGLDPMQPGNRITVAAVYDPDTGVERVFNFLTGDNPEDFLAMLDGAERLCAFNGARFDIPFIQKSLHVHPPRAQAWLAKLFDVFEICKLAINVTFSLNALLAENGMPTKTGSGLEAIALARKGDHERLQAYCMDDTRFTHQVSSLDRIALPKCAGVFLTPRGRGLFEKDAA